MAGIIPSRCCFLVAADHVSLMPDMEGYEIAFWGRSNVGKSSLMNALMGRVGLARVSKTPGRTQGINFYQVHPILRFVDLPGYGYANVPIALQKKWDSLLSSYFKVRQNLLWIYFLIDSRRGLSPLDREALTFLQLHRRRYRCLLTKADAISASQLETVVQDISHTGLFEEPALTTSAKKKQGMQMIHQEIEALLLQ